MNATVEEWIAKSDGDHATAGRELAAIERPNSDAVCFHAQQCVEKLMKALAIARGVVPPRTHDLVVLSDLLIPLYGGWAWPASELRVLTQGAVVFRYPGESAGPDDATLAFDIATRVRAALLTALGRDS